MKKTLLTCLLLLTAACAPTLSQPESQVAWGNIKYSDGAILDTSGLLRMGK